LVYNFLHNTTLRRGNALKPNSGEVDSGLAEVSRCRAPRLANDAANQTTVSFEFSTVMSRNLRRHFLPVLLLLSFSSLTASLALIAYQEILRNPIELPHADKIVSLLGVPAEPGVDWPGGWNTPAFAAISVFQTTPLNIGRDVERQETVLTCVADASFFSVLSVGAERGRLFIKEDAEAGAAPVAVISHMFWKSHFGGVEDLQELKFFAAGHWIQVIGVLPAKVVFPAHAAVYLPHPNQRLSFYEPSQEGSADDISHGFDLVIARLRPGFTVAQATGMLKGVNQHLREISKKPHRPLSAVGARLLRDTVTIYVKGEVTEVILAGVFVALVGFLSLFFLSAARTAELQKDVAIRVALGAGTGRLLRREVIRWIYAGSLASVAVLASVEFALRTARRMEGLAVPRLGDLSLTLPQSTWIVAGTMAVAILLAVPYLLACRKMEPVTPVLNRGESQSRVTIKPAVGRIVSIGQLSLAIALTAIAITVCLSYWRLALAPPGIQPSRLFVSSPVLASSLNLGNPTTNNPGASVGNGIEQNDSAKPGERSKESARSSSASADNGGAGSRGATVPNGGLFQATLAAESQSDYKSRNYIMDREASRAASELRLQPGVAAVALIDPAPYEFRSGSGFAVNIDGQPLEWAVTTYTAWGDVPDALGIRVLQGRWFEKGDYGANVAVIGDTFSKRYFGGNPLGRTLFIEQNS